MQRRGHEVQHQLSGAVAGPCPHRARKARDAGDRGCVTAEPLSNVWIAVPARRDWSLRRAIPVVPRPSFRVPLTCVLSFTTFNLPAARWPPGAQTGAGVLGTASTPARPVRAIHLTGQFVLCRVSWTCSSTMTGTLPHSAANIYPDHHRFSKIVCCGSLAGVSGPWRQARSMPSGLWSTWTEECLCPRPPGGGITCPWRLRGALTVSSRSGPARSPPAAPPEVARQPSADR